MGGVEKRSGRYREKEWEIQRKGVGDIEKRSGKYREKEWEI